MKKIWTAGTLQYTATGLVILFLWLMFGDFGYAMKDRATGMVAGLMLKSFGVSELLFGIIMISFTNFTNIFLCPIVAYRSDRHRGKYGRRIPYILFTTPFVVVGLAGIGLTPILARYLAPELGIRYPLTAVIIFCVFWVIFDFGNTLISAIFNALVNDVVPTAFLGRFFAMFRTVSLGCGFLFNLYAVGYAKSEATVIMVGLAVLYGVGLLGICLKVKEGEYPPPPEEPADGGAPTVSGAVKTYFRECFALPYYRWVIMVPVLISIAGFGINVHSVFFSEKVHMSLETFGKLTAWFCFSSFVLSFFLGWLADRFHPIRVGMASYILVVITFFYGGFFATDACSFGIFYFVWNFLMMATNTLMTSYGPRLYPKAYFAQFSSASMLCGAIACVIQAPIVGGFLDLTGKNYQLLMTLSGVIAFSALFALYKVYRHFLRLGGDAAYEAPPPPSLPRE